MVLAARTLGIPAALTEADAHLGLANRLAAPFARAVFLAFPLDGLDGPKYRVVGRPIPARSRPPAPRRGAAAFGLPADGPVVLVFGGSQGARALNEAAVEAFAESGPAVLHLAGERDFPELERRPRRDDYRLLPVHRRVRRRARRSRPGRRARRRLGLGGRGRRQARAARPVPARDRRPPDEERPLLRAGRRSGRRPRGRARPAAAGRRAPRRPRAARGDGSGDARAGEARRRRRRRGGADGACPSLTAAASGSPASAAPG